MSVASIELKKINLGRVYRAIYDSQDGLTKKELARSLDLSLPTITQNLDILQQDNKIVSGLRHETTSGRPSAFYRFNELRRIAIGVEILAHKINVAAVDLRGNMRKEDTMELFFSIDENYFEILGKWVMRFISSLEWKKEDILGVTIGVQGLVAPDGEHMSYSQILSNGDFTRTDFARHMDIDVALSHDAELAAISELWMLKDIRHAIYLCLNQHIGSALIYNRELLLTKELSAGVTEHMQIFPGGNVCYCGKEGCAEAHCSAGALIRRAGDSLPSFFNRVSKKHPAAVVALDLYLRDLAVYIDNIRMNMCGDVIIGGEVAEYLSDHDLQQLGVYVDELTTFKNVSCRIVRGVRGEKAALSGGGLMRVFDYLKSEGLR